MKSIEREREYRENRGNRNNKENREERIKYEIRGRKEIEEGKVGWVIRVANMYAVGDN